MAGTRHRRTSAAERRAAACRGSRRRVPGRAHRPEGARGLGRISLDIVEGETLGLVGESGLRQVDDRARRSCSCHRRCRAACVFDGDRAHRARRARTLRKLRPRMQMIFQDPISSLNPRRRVREIVAEGLDIWKIGDKASARTRRSTRCSRPSASIPRTANGGRTSSPAVSASASRSLAAVVTEPKLIICDEPVSALDVSVQAQILNLLEDMKAALRPHARLHRARPRRREERQRPGRW